MHSVEPGSLQRLIRLVMDNDLCTSCGACAGTCPYLRVHGDRVVALDRCTRDTGHCIAACPRVPDARSLGELLPAATDVAPAYRARATDEAMRKRAQNGGVVSALLCWALSAKRINGALVAGGDAMRPVARVARSVEEILGAQGAKYTMAPLVALLHRLPDAGEIAVVALPCQATAIRRIATAVVPRPIRTPLIIGMHCAGALDGGALRQSVHGVARGRRVVRLDFVPSARDDQARYARGALRLEFASGDSAQLTPEQTDRISRAGCRPCADLSAEDADVSIGVDPSDPSHNLVQVRTRRGQELWADAVAADAIHAFPAAPETLADLRGAEQRKRSRARLAIGDGTPRLDDL